MDCAGGRQRREQMVVVMSLAESFDVSIVFGDGGDDGLHLSHQDLDVDDRRSHDRRIFGQRDGSFDLCQPALVG